MKAKEILKEASLILKASGLEGPGAEAMALIREIVGIGAAEFYSDNPMVPDGPAEEVLEAARRRALREPLQYITGRAEFMGMVFRVGPGVLVPRPETELLVEEFCRLFPDRQSSPYVADICAGSGCIALAIASRYPRARITATDASAIALGYALDNASRLGIGNVNFIEGSLLDPLIGEVFDVIVSNPPYIPEGEIDSLMPEVSSFEPREALDGGKDGLDFYRLLIDGAGAHLKPGGLIILELGAGQREEIEAMASEAGFAINGVIKDVSGHERVVVIGS